MDFVGALFLPYSGLMRAVEMIAKSSKPGASDLRKAANAGALCMVVKVAPQSLVERIRRKKHGLPPDPSDVEKEHSAENPENQSLHNQLLPKPSSVEQHQTASITLETHPVSDRNDDGDENDQDLHTSRFTRYVKRILFLLSTTNPQARKIHGSCKLPKGYLLAPVPSNAVFERQAGGEGAEVKITTTYNGIKAAAAVGQAIFASITLYEARGDQRKRYGYAAYGLTVLPFLIMSITNLCVNIVSADYPTMCCVESTDSDEAVAKGGHIVGAVWRLAKSTEWNPMVVQEENLIFSADTAESDRYFDDRYDVDRPPYWQARIQRFGHKKWSYPIHLLAKLMVIGGMGSLPIIVIKVLTHFDPGESTHAQRAWLMTWLVLGCWFGPYMASSHPAYYRDVTLWNKAYYPLMAPGIGGVVVVAQMILSYGWCTRFDTLTN